MANYRSACYLPAALTSILSQTVSDIEVIVCDDASPDDSVAVIEEFARRDSRVRLIACKANAGPGAARNRALDAARGQWVSVVDSDDVVHPERLEILLAWAGKLDADIVADDLLFFAEGGGRGTGATLLGAAAVDFPQRISPAHFIRCNTSGSGLPALGYLKPLLRRAAVGGIRYDEAARIGEDYDFLLRCLLAGRSLFVLPELLYFYRRHAASISHRLSEATVEGMIAGQEALVQQASAAGLQPEVSAALVARADALRSSLAFERLVAALKGRRPFQALRLLGASPWLAARLWDSWREHLSAKVTEERPASPSSLILHEKGKSFDRALPSRLGLREPFVEVAVPAWTARGETASRIVWSELAGAGARGDVQLVCHGLAALHAAPYAMGEIAAAVIAEPDDIAAAAAIGLSTGIPLFVPPEVAGMVAQASEAALPGYHRIVQVPTAKETAHAG